MRAYDPVRAVLAADRFCGHRRLYAFDVHCNAYFPLFILLYGAHKRALSSASAECSAALPPRTLYTILLSTRPTLCFKSYSSVRRALCALLSAVAQFLLSPLLLWRSFVATLLSNALYGAAFSYYHYITFLGYSSLPFLSDTVVRALIIHSAAPPCISRACDLSCKERPTSFATLRCCSIPRYQCGGARSWNSGSHKTRHSCSLADAMHAVRGIGVRCASWPAKCTLSTVLTVFPMLAAVLVPNWSDSGGCALLYIAGVQPYEVHPEHLLLKRRCS